MKYNPPRRSPVTIRFKVVAVLLTLCVMAAAQAPLLMMLQRATVAARDEADRRARVRDQSFQLELALLEINGESRVHLLSGPTASTETLERLSQQYARRLAGLRVLTRDAEQRTHLDAIERYGEEWMGWWRDSSRIEAGRRSPTDVLAALESRFLPVRYELDRLRSRQDLLYASARAEARRTADSATATMFTMALITIGVMLIAVLGLGRLILTPLAELAEAAGRIGRGEYPEIPGASRRDEIGLLVSAFTTMSRTVRAREEELSKAREQAEKERAELMAITRTVPAALLLIDSSDHIRSQNEAATALLGPATPPDDPASFHQHRFTLLGRDGTELPIEQWPTTRALAGETVVGQEVVVRTVDGRETPMLASAAPLPYWPRERRLIERPVASGKTFGAVVVFQDVSALKALDRMKDEFVSTVSHELRTPLTSIRGSLQLVLDEPGSVPDVEHRQLIGVALSNCERLIRIINDILDVSKIEAGKTALRRRPCSVREFVQPAVESVASLARHAGVAFDLHLAQDLPPVFADPDRMIQVLVNLLSNAVKFAPRNSRVTLEAAQTDGTVEISVADRGPGINPADVPLLFEKFRQVDRSSSRNRGGTGLGLAIVKGLIEEHGGTIRVESAPGEGARFIFTVPAASPAVLETAATRASEPHDARRRAHAAVVLVADDDEDFRHVMRKQLERAGFRVMEAADGESVLRIARDSHIDAITLDLLMPGMNGWTVLQHLTADAELSRIPVLVISSIADRPGQLARDVAVFAKTIGSQDLIREITRLLPQAAQGTVLVAEDDDDLRALLVHTLRKRGFIALEARDGAEAMAFLDRAAVSLVVLDLNMPNVTGIDVLEHLRHKPGASVPVLVISGWGDNECRVMNLGASGYLSKPLDVAEVARIAQTLTTRT